MTPTPEMLAYYAAFGPLTDPAPQGDLLAGLPGDLPALCRVVQNTLIHIFWAERYGRALSEDEKGTVNVRRAADKLALIRSRLDRPLAEPRPLELRQVGNCRDFSLLLATLLQARGIPARPRCGFGAYFMPDHFEDHWVCEYWDAARQRWALVDSQLDAVQCEALQPPFDPLDVPRDQFISGGLAWQMCRQGLARPEQFGIFDMHGWWFVWGNVARDFLALNKVEILPWDYELGAFTHPLEDPFPEDAQEIAFYDQIAALTLAGDVGFAALRQVYEADPRWRVPAAWLAPQSGVQA